MVCGSGNGKLVWPSELGGVLLNHKTVESRHAIELENAPDFELATPVGKGIGDIHQCLRVDFQAVGHLGVAQISKGRGVCQ